MSHGRLGIMYQEVTSQSAVISFVEMGGNVEPYRL